MASCFAAKPLKRGNLQMKMLSQRPSFRDALYIWITALSKPRLLPVQASTGVISVAMTVEREELDSMTALAHVVDLISFRVSYCAERIQ